MGVGHHTATALAMLVHELATNSVKYGALSAAEGFLDVSSKTDHDDIYLIWAETGGPMVPKPPEMTGFGSKLVKRSVSAQLGGELTYDWQENGLVVTIKMLANRLAD